MTQVLQIVVALRGNQTKIKAEEKKKRKDKIKEGKKKKKVDKCTDNRVTDSQAASRVAPNEQKME